MRFTHAIVVRIPQNLKFESKKAAKHTDVATARKQQEDLNDTLREAGVDVIELPPEEGTHPVNLFADDTMVVINGTALITRPKKGNSRTKEIAEIVREFALQLLEAPEQERGKNVVLEGSDVVFTGREIFVGLRKNGTNMEGALVVARTFPDLPVIPIQLPNQQPLKFFVSVAADGILAMGKTKEATIVRQRIERESTFRYKVLSVEADELIGCLNVNSHAIFRQDKKESVKFRDLQPPIELWGIAGDELTKIGAPFSRFVLLVRKITSLKHIS
ncbi:Dimethylargininase [Aphelenchoides fujianensis]|nr:Dimethylargininase [Aphelenchoides fujianensis]KAI6239380.1 Dimethylargininase [Aphelenchoides fujianensis]